MQKQITNLAKKLIQIPSVSKDIEQLNRVVDIVKREFEDSSELVIKQYEFENKPSLVIQNFEGKQADIILNWHLDVVPAQDERQFEPQIKDWRLFGRGACDMKTQVAIMIVLMKQIWKSENKLPKVILMITTDEEKWGFDGVKRLVDEGYSADIVLVPDGGSMSNLVIKQKGIVHLNIVAEWKSSHGSQIWKWDNAIEKLYDFYQDLKDQIQIKYEKNTQDHRHPTVSLNKLNAGEATNVVPNQANGKIDIRFTETFDWVDSLFEDIKKVAKKYDCKVSMDASWTQLNTNKNAKPVQKYFQVAQKHNPNIEFGHEHGWSDGRFFAKKWIDVVLQRPKGGNLHQKNERIDLESCDQFFRLYKDFIWKY